MSYPFRHDFIFPSLNNSGFFRGLVILIYFDQSVFKCPVFQKAVVRNAMLGQQFVENGILDMSGTFKIDNHEDKHKGCS